jgi:hypothetical protein
MPGSWLFFENGGRSKRVNYQGLSMQASDKIFSSIVTAKQPVRLNQTEPVPSDASAATDGWKIAGYVVAGLAVVAVAGVYAYRSQKRKRPMTRLQHLKAQLGLTDADFKDLKANLSKLNLAQLRELNKAAW